MITYLHKIIKIGRSIWSLLPFAVAFLNLAYLFCVQIIRKQLCFDIFSTFWKFYDWNLYYTGIYCCLEYIYVKSGFLKKWSLLPFAGVGQNYFTNCWQGAAFRIILKALFRATTKNNSRLARSAYSCWQGAAFSLWLVTGCPICLCNFFVLKKSELLLTKAWQFQTCQMAKSLKFL